MSNRTRNGLANASIIRPTRKSNEPAHQYGNRLGKWRDQFLPADLHFDRLLSLELKPGQLNLLETLRINTACGLGIPRVPSQVAGDAHPDPTRYWNPILRRTEITTQETPPATEISMDGYRRTCRRRDLLQQLQAVVDAMWEARNQLIEARGI